MEVPPLGGYVRIEDAAARLGVRPYRVREDIDAGILPALWRWVPDHTAGWWEIEDDDVARLLASRAAPPRPALPSPARETRPRKPSPAGGSRIGPGRTAGGAVVIAAPAPTPAPAPTSAPAPTPTPSPTPPSAPPEVPPPSQRTPDPSRRAPSDVHPVLCVISETHGRMLDALARDWETDTRGAVEYMLDFIVLSHPPPSTAGARRESATGPTVAPDQRRTGA